MASVVQAPRAAMAAPVDAPLRGIAYLLCGVAVFALQDVVMKFFATSTYPVLEVVFVRSVLALAILALIAWRVEGRRAFTTRRPGLHALRGLLGCLSYTTYYMAFAAMPLADAVALFFAAPLFLTALSVLLLGERVGLHRWAAVSIGFAGVLVMLRPGSSVFEPAALLAVLGALAYSAMQLVTRRLAANDSSLCMSMSINACYLLLAGVSALLLADPQPAPDLHPSVEFLVREWHWPAPRDLGLMLSLGVIASAGFFCLTRAYSIAPTSTVAPFEYSMMLWGIAWGFVFFGELPDATVVVGAVITAAAGLYVLHRERIAAARAAAAAGTGA